MSCKPNCHRCRKSVDNSDIQQAIYILAHADRYSSKEISDAQRTLESHKESPSGKT